MNNRIALLAGASVVAVVAALGAGYYFGHSSSPGAAPPVATGAAESPAAMPMTPPQEAASTVPAESAATPAATATKPAVRRRYADYANRESEYSAPPPPPPPPRAEREDRPDPFRGRFATFPMHHIGNGTVQAPLTWSAQTAFGDGQEADLRISILVPEPAPSDRGEFWRAWGGRDRDNLMPDVTRGTPVVVTGSVSVVVGVDPDLLDLDAPAILIVEGDRGRLVYRSRDVAPARGEAWDSRGARWIFVPDAEFYRAMRDGAAVSVEVHSRVSDRDIRIPFATDDFAPSARDFERALYGRISQVAGRWDESRGGRPPPPPPPPAPPLPVTHPAPVIVAPPAAAPAQPGQPGWDHHRGDRGGPGAPVPPTQPQAAPPAASAPPPAAPTAPTPPQQQPGANGEHRGGHSDHGSDEHGGPGAAANGPGAPNGMPPARPATPFPARPSPAPAVVPAPTAPERSAETPVAAKPVTPPESKPAGLSPALQAQIAAYRPPEETCGPQPALPAASPETYASLTRDQLTAMRPVVIKDQTWLACHNAWVGRFSAGIFTLGKAVAGPGQQALTALAANGGGAAVAAYEKAAHENTATQAQWLAHIRAFQTALAGAK
ncbi:MAG: hypothetical protein WDM91_04955 [Rhizomicrobium sp.]